jgi:uncharacterized protein (TIGR03067 family)
MKRIAVIVVAAGLALGSALVAQEKPADPAAKGVPAMQGTWMVLTINGQPVADAGVTMTLAIDGEKYTQTVNGDVNERGTIKVDQSKKPPTIDFTITEGPDTGKPQVGLVEVAGDTMTMKLSQPGSATRPTSMSPEEGFFIVTAKKSK